MDSTDLVKRLRESDDDWPAALVVLEREAADRIEELERELAQVRFWGGFNDYMPKEEYDAAAALAIAAENSMGDDEIINNAVRLLRSMRATEQVFAVYGMEAVSAYNALWESLGRPDLEKP